MKGIDNLREYVLIAPSICSTTRAILVGYIDGIEREVAEVRDREYRNGMEDGEMAAERDGWVRLPVDADGVPIHVGDAMEADNGTTFEVEHISLYQWGWRCVGEGTDRSGVTCTAHAIPDGCRHHHAPTVEDVLEEFVARWMETHHDDIPALKAEYAAKLRLTEGEDA